MPTKVQDCRHHMRFSQRGKLSACVNCGAPPGKPAKKSKKHSIRFQPFVSFQPDPRSLADAGLSRLQRSRAEGGGTAFTSEAQLNRYLASEKAHGRDVGWRDMDYTSIGARIR